jgi:hypothetical protein
MFCDQCGANTEPAAAFCAGCGAQLPSAAATGDAVNVAPGIRPSPAPTELDDATRLAIYREIFESVGEGHLLDKEALTATELHRLQRKLEAGPVHLSPASAQSHHTLTNQRRLGSVAAPLMGVLGLIFLVVVLGWAAMTAKGESADSNSSQAPSQEPVHTPSSTPAPATNVSPSEPVPRVQLPDFLRDRPWVSAAPPGDVIDYGVGPRFGTRYASGVSFRTSFGVSAKINGEDAGQWTRWTFHCEAEGRGPCLVTTLTIPQKDTIEEFQINTHSYDTAEGTLTNLQVDAARGTVGFTLAASDAPIQVRFKFGTQGDDLYLRHFTASSFKRISGPPSTTVGTPLVDSSVEYSLAPLDQVVNVPILLRGRQTPGAKAWTSVVETLSASDQQAWSALLPGIDPIETDQKVIERRLSAELGVDFSAKGFEPTPDQMAAYLRINTELYVENLNEVLMRSSMSETGRRRLAEHTSTQMREFANIAIQQMRQATAAKGQ